MRRVVVTGMGALSPIGNTVDEMWQAARAGVCGIGPITQYDSDLTRVKVAGEVKGFEPTDFIDKREARKHERFVLFAMVAADEAMRNSGIDMAAEDADRCGVVVSSGVGGLEGIERERDRGLAKGFDRVSPHFIPSIITNIAAGNIAIRHGLRGECSCVVSACAGGTNAIGEALRTIRDGYQDVMLAGGTESCITPLGVGGFTVMRALTEEPDVNRASIPFDLERSGFVIGEGAGILVLEELEHARARGANIIAEVCGYGYTCDAYHVTAPRPDGTGAVSCMRRALEDAHIAPGDIGYINAHGTSTPLNDKNESAAIHEVFGTGSDAPLVSSTKSMTGHMLGAAGAVEAILTVCALHDGYVPATVNYRVPDPECNLNLVAGHGCEAQVDYALSDSLGFGGHNAAVVFGRYRKQK